jgi:hypothetical protein
VSTDSNSISPESINSLLGKLRHHSLTKDEAKGFLSLLENEAKLARDGDRKEYEKIAIQLIRIVKMFLTGAVDLNSVSFDILNELDQSHPRS